MQEEVAARFKPNCALEVNPGASAFFRGAFNDTDTPVGEQQMLAAARAYYSSWLPGEAEAKLASIASPDLKLFNPCWTPQGEAEPASREDAAAAIEQRMLAAGGELKFDAKSVAHAEGTNMVCSAACSCGMYHANAFGHPASPGKPLYPVLRATWTSTFQGQSMLCCSRLLFPVMLILRPSMLFPQWPNCSWLTWDTMHRASERDVSPVSGPVRTCPDVHCCRLAGATRQHAPQWMLVASPVRRCCICGCFPEALSKVSDASFFQLCVHWH